MGIFTFLRCCTELHVPFKKPVLICVFLRLCSSTPSMNVDTVLIMKLLIILNCALFVFWLGFFFVVGWLGFLLGVCGIFLFLFNRLYESSAFNLWTIYGQRVAEFPLPIPVFSSPHSACDQLLCESCNGTLAMSNFLNNFLPLLYID